MSPYDAHDGPAADPSSEAPLSPAQERQLAAALGELPAADEEARALRALVVEARAATSSEGVPVAAHRVAALQEAAADAAFERTARERRSTWSLLRTGLHHSALLRVAAASLLVHLCALPVLAYLHFTAVAKPALYIDIERDRPLPVAEEVTEQLPPPVTEEPAEGELDLNAPEEGDAKPGDND